MNDIRTPNFEEPDREGDDLRERVTAAMSEDDLTQSATAKEIGTSGSALNQWLGHKYKGNNAALDQLVRQWLDARERRQQLALQIPDAPEWFEGPTARDLLTMLTFAQADGSIVTITGTPGVGKTKACERFRNGNPGTVWLATMSPHVSSVVIALQKIAKAVGIREMTHTGAMALFEAINNRVSATRGLLIVDETQHLAVRILDEIRSIHDETGVGIAFVGNPDVDGRLVGGGRSGGASQIYSRVAGRRVITKPVAGDVRAQLDAWGLECSGCFAFLEEVAKKGGALRFVNHTLRRAVFHAGSVDKVTIDHLREAYRSLGFVQ